LSPDGQLLVGSYNKSCLASILNGNRNWQFTDGTNHYVAPPLATDKGIYAPNTDDNVYALNSNGTLDWTFTSNGEVWAQPLSDMDCDCIYLSAMDHYLYSLNPDNGSIIWQSEKLGGSVLGVPALSAEKVLYVGTFGAGYCLNANGELGGRRPKT
jgi:outer membrane protein assembly factor BamB